MMRLVAHVLLSLAMVEMVPTSVPALELAHLPEAREGVAMRREITNVVSPHLPIDVGVRPPRKKDPASLGIVTTASSAIVADKASGEVLFEKRIDEVRSIGSITKLMTAVVFLGTSPDLDVKAAVREEDVRSGGRDHLYIDDEVTVKDLLEASLVGSDNPATMSLMRLSGLTPEAFVERMNEQAKAWGMDHTRFVEPTGLDARNVSTARDLVVLFRRALDEARIRDVTQQSAVTFTSANREYVVPTTNLLLGSFLNSDPYSIVGGKTGYLPSAGYCVGVEVSDGNGHAVITVVLGSDTITTRFQEAKGLTSWVFDTYQWPDGAL